MAGLDVSKPSGFASWLPRYRRNAVLASVIGGLSLSGCGEDGTVVIDNTPQVASIVVSPDTVAMYAVGEAAEFSATAKTEFGSEIPDVTFEWASSDPDVASIDQSGEVTGKKDGIAAITATASDVSGSSTLLIDPNMVLKNYCTKCHRGFHIEKFATNSCPACHSVSLDPRIDPAHHSLSNGHQTVSGNFDLAGAHVQAFCEACHDLETAEPMFSASLQNDCYVCHDSDYEAQHAGSGFPKACMGCHNLVSWSGATFDHKTASGGFELRGAHTQLPCASCHDPVSGDPLFSPASDSDCFACHADDYQSQHAGSGYPTTCLTCHTINSFAGANFNHDAQYFPIFSGKHRSEWSGCDTCHPNSDNFAVFTCFNCHKHDQEETNDKHSDVSGYAYESNRCLACHPDGSS